MRDPSTGDADPTDPFLTTLRGALHSEAADADAPSTGLVARAARRAGARRRNRALALGTIVVLAAGGTAAGVIASGGHAAHQVELPGSPPPASAGLDALLDVMQPTFATLLPPGHVAHVAPSGPPARLSAGRTLVSGHLYVGYEIAQQRHVSDLRDVGTAAPARQPDGSLLVTFSGPYRHRAGLLRPDGVLLTVVVFGDAPTVRLPSAARLAQAVLAAAAAAWPAPAR